MTRREDVESFFENLWSRRDLSTVDERVAEDCRIHGLPATQHGRAAFRGFVELFGAAFAKTDVTVEDAIEDGDRIFFRATVHLVDHAGRKHTMSGGGMTRWRDGQIVEAWNEWDFLKLLVDTGAVGADAFVEKMSAMAKQSA